MAMVEAPLYGDLLETVLSHVSLLDLVPALYVSKAWHRAAALSVRDPTRLKPWLILHLQNPRNPSATTTHAYDPHSHVWINIPRVPSLDTCALRSSYSNLLYTLSPAKLAYSFDPLNVLWNSIAVPRVWRTDPIVARVTSHIIVAGGVCEFEDDLLAVEVFDTESESGLWVTCESMPTIFKNSAAATWLSATTSDRKFYVLEKNSGAFCSFDLETKRWGSTSDLRPDPSVFYSVIGFLGHRLIFFGLGSNGPDLNSLSLRLWEVNCDTLDHREIGKMPSEMLLRLIDENSPFSLIFNVSLTGDYAYIYNPSDLKEIFACDLAAAAGSGWGSIPNSILRDQYRMNRFMFTSSTVGIDDLQMVLRSRSRKFTASLAGK